MNAEDDSDFVYGYGNTKHIRDPGAPFAKAGGPEAWRGEWGLCGAAGGLPTPQPERPLCKRCERKATLRREAADLIANLKGRGR